MIFAILKKEKILLMFNKKVASCSIEYLFNKTLKYNDNLHDKHKQQSINNDFHKYNDYKKVILARNPYNRILSAYNDNICYKTLHYSITGRKYMGTRLTFEEFVDKICDTPDKNEINKHVTSQTYNIHIKNIKIIKLEDMIGWDDLRLPKLPHIHKTETKIITEIPKHLKYKIYIRYKNDFEILNYERKDK